MKSLLVGLLATAAFISPACAQHYCGHDVEPTNTHTVFLPHTGQTIVGTQVAQYGLDGGDGSGVAVQGQHRYCGEIALYLYTGNAPSSDLYIEVHLDPTIVSPSVAQAKCFLTPAHTDSVYYEGYADAGWPGSHNYESYPDGQYTTSSSNWYGGATHLVVPAVVYSDSNASSSFNAFTTYTLNVLCPPNLTNN